MVGYPSNSIAVAAPSVGSTLRLSGGVPVTVGGAGSSALRSSLASTLSEFIGGAMLEAPVGVALAGVWELGVRDDEMIRKGYAPTGLFGYRKLSEDFSVARGAEVWDPAANGWALVTGECDVVAARNGPWRGGGEFGNVSAWPGFADLFPGACELTWNAPNNWPGVWSVVGGYRAAFYERVGGDYANSSLVISGGYAVYEAVGVSSAPPFTASPSVVLPVGGGNWVPAWIETGSGARAAPMPDADRRRPPGPRTKERKVRALGRGTLLNVIQAREHDLTEALDLLDALWSALPKRLRTSSKCGTPGTLKVAVTALNNLKDGKNGSGCYVTPQQKAKDVYAHFSEIPMEDAIRAIINNDIGDRFTGAQFGAVAAFGNKVGFKSTGLLNQAALPPPQFDKDWNLVWVPLGSKGPKFTVPSGYVLTNWAN